MTNALLCSSCRGSLPADAAFCPRCGAPVGARPARPLSPWLVAAAATIAIVLVLAVVLWRGNAVPRSPVVAASPAPASMPDISGMSRKEQFDRLYDRILQALRAGDTVTLDRFAPMALAAYQMMDSTEVDSTTRRRAAILRLHLGDTTVQLPKPR